MLESIRCWSHRPAIHNLAKTCRGIRSVVTSAVRRLPEPCPRCTQDLKRCAFCRTLVCGDCGTLRQATETPEETMTSVHATHAVLGGHTPAMRQEISTKLQAVLPGRTYVSIEQVVKTTYLCEVCLHNPGARLGKDASEYNRHWEPQSVPADQVLEQGPPRNLEPLSEWRLLLVPKLLWSDIPHLDNLCCCSQFPTGCGTSPHLVSIEDLPTECELAGFLMCQMRWRGFPAEIRRITNPLTRGMEPVAFPFYVLD